MAESNNGSSATPWLAFLVGIVVMALLAVGFFMLNEPAREQAELEMPRLEAPQINPPDINIEMPDVDVNPPPAQPAEAAPEPDPE